VTRWTVEALAGGKSVEVRPEIFRKKSQAVDLARQLPPQLDRDGRPLPVRWEPVIYDYAGGPAAQVFGVILAIFSNLIGLALTLGVVAFVVYACAVASNR
jgi:hypothetical protein